jgi:hypothetical protein
VQLGSANRRHLEDFVRYDPVPTGWKTVGLDHLAFHVADYRKKAAFFIALIGWTLRSDNGNEAVVDIGDWASVVFNLLGWKPTYDEASQNECLIRDVGAVIIRGGNALSHAFRPTSASAGTIDHIWATWCGREDLNLHWVAPTSS